MEVGKKCRTVLAVLTSPLSTEIGLKQAVMVWSLFPHPSSSLNCDEAKLSKVNLGHWWKSKVWRCHFVWLKVGCPGCARKGDVYQMCLSSKPCSPGRQASLRRGWSCVSCVLVDMDSQGVPFAQPAQGEPWLGHLRAASYSFGIWGCWSGLRRVSVEGKKCMVDKEELGVLCWAYLGNIWYISMKKWGVLFFKKICSDRSSFIFTVYVCKSIVKVLQWF